MRIPSKHSITCGLTVCLLCLFAACSTTRTPEVCFAPGGTVQSYFSPKGGCTDAIVSEFTNATQTILIAAYIFTAAPIAEALRDAHRRKVRVEVILDSSQKTDKYTVATFLDHAGIPVFIDSRHKIFHSKFAVIDGETVITGSFNYTKSAEESNAENLLIIRDRVLAQRYTENWQIHREHAERH